MFFGTREITKQMGAFSSEKCKECKSSYTYTFKKTTKYLVAFFINLIPLKTSYQSVCEECGAQEAVDAQAGKAIANKEFVKATARQNLLGIIKIAALLIVIAAAVILPLTLIKDAGPSTAALKALVDEDGTYSIHDEQGEMLAVIDVNAGEKTVSFYDDRSVLVGEPGADGSFIMHEYYEEVTTEDGKTHLERTLDNVGVLKDRYNTAIRSYYYDLANESLGYAQGIQDLTTIDYSPELVTYNYVYHASDTEKQDFVVMLHLADTYRLSVTFVPMLTGENEMGLGTLTLIDIENGKDTAETIYYLGNDEMETANSTGISVASSADDILSFIEQSDIKYAYQETYTYYEDTEMFSEIAVSMPDADGNMQTASQKFDTMEKDGYYIQTAHIE